jgi:2,5-dichloro-2,5-cyclohexadiene-1,4-diol dehydrogenase 1
MYDLKRKSILITGAGSGMGKSAALLAAQAGARVTVADINAESAEETTKLILAAGGVAQFVHVDISNEDDVKRMVERAVSAFDRLDGAFNNAAIPQAGVLLHDLTLAAFNKTMGINVSGTFLCMKYEIQAMLRGGGGSIVNTASAAGAVGFPLAAEYIASKHAVVGLTKGAAIDYGKQNIRVNAILPGATLTPMLQGAMSQMPDLERYLIDQQPIGRLGQPFEIATAAIWLLSDHASFVTGAGFAVDGGYIAK